VGRPAGNHRAPGCSVTDTRKAGSPTGPGLGISGQEATEHPDDTDLLRVAHDAVARLVCAAASMHGPVPALGTPEWFSAEWTSQVAAVAVAALGDPAEQTAAEKQAATAISASLNWSEASHRPSYATLVARRAVPGPMARRVDPEAAARWARTGSSAGVAA